MTTLCHLILQAIAIYRDMLLVRLDPRTPLRNEIERLRHEVDADKRRADYWSERVRALLTESVRDDVEIRRLNLQNAYLLTMLTEMRANDDGGQPLTINMSAERVLP